FTLALSAITLLFLAKSAGGNVFARVTAQRLFYLSSIIVTFAVILLFQAFLGHDFSITYVYQHSSFDLPILYRFSAFWAGQEGGFLLWLFFLSIIGIVIILSKDENESILMSLLIITQVFILINLTIKSPFARLWETHPDQFTRTLPMLLDGMGLNPLLQDFWMAIHPPVLFAGYAAAVVPFAYAVAALLKQDYSIMPKRAYRWVIFTVTALGLGIFLGGYWAYAVLGWGGYWGWDPVENSSLVPWLLLIALLHGIILQNRKGALVRTNLILAMSSFVLVLYSTYLTRSGVLANFSVHSFAGDTVSHQILYYILFFIIIGAVLLAMRNRSIISKPLDGTLLSSTNLLFYGIVLIILYTVMILIGTSMPIISGILMENATTVTEDFYNTWSIPVALLILSFIAIAAFYRGGTLKKATLAIITAVSILTGVLFNLFHTAHPAAYLLSVFAVFTVLAIALDWL
ncbi:MAG: cytochrome C biogenesis protein, partial [Candidatus Melainabacteria bacterium HGW-Melainabacteria-1]